MNTDLTTKLKDYLNQNVEDYVSASSVWETDAEIMATANLLGCHVVAHSQVGDSKDWLTY